MFNRIFAYYNASNSVNEANMREKQIAEKRTFSPMMRYLRLWLDDVRRRPRYVDIVFNKKPTTSDFADILKNFTTFMQLKIPVDWYKESNSNIVDCQRSYSMLQFLVYMNNILCFLWEETTCKYKDIIQYQ